MQKKKRIIQPTSRCGLNCKSCTAFIATMTNDDTLRQKTAVEWNKRYNKDGRESISAKDINCLGCLSVKQPIYKHCYECGVRMCAVLKNVRNCGECATYDSCEKIALLHTYIPEGKIVCDRIRSLFDSRQ